MLTDSDFKNIVGKTINEAKEELPKGYFIFIGEEDGQSFYRPAEFNPYRINVIVKRGRINHIQGVN